VFPGPRPLDAVRDTILYIIIIIIIIVLVINLFRVQTNQISNVHIVAAVLYLHSVLHV